jgi:hypothetical protein
VRDQRAARNFAVLRKIALNLVGRDRSAKASMRAKRKKAAWNDRYTPFTSEPENPWAR